MSTELYIDIFPPFTYFGNSPRYLFDGDFTDYGILGEGNPGGKSFSSAEECNALCKTTPDCEIFLWGVPGGTNPGTCIAFKAGTDFSYEANRYKLYVKLDETEMDNC